MAKKILPALTEMNTKIVNQVCCGKWKKMRLFLFANKNKVKILKEMPKKIEGKTGPRSPEENLHIALQLKKVKKK